MEQNSRVRTGEKLLEGLWQVYHDDLPPILLDLAATPPMQRLKDVGMNCGCEYTAYDCFSRLLRYSRYTHSVGVGLIVWHFTHDAAQAAAGLLHDIATPTFAHVVDFLHGDYLTQEATEDGTRQRIEQSREIQAVLGRYGLCTEDVCDYHRYPIADNDSPRLSADRLEYTLGNVLNFHLGTPAEAAALYRALTVAENEDGLPELAFSDAASALRFARIALDCAEVYVRDEDRYAMQMLAELLRDAMAAGALREQDLTGTESDLIETLCKAPEWRRRWAEFRSLHDLETSRTPKGAGWRCVDAKRRCIDPLIAGQGRVSACFPDFGARMQAFRTRRLDHWVREKRPAAE